MLTAFIADDEIWIIRGLQKLLSKTGYDVTVVGTATDGFAARQGIASLKPDMIFSDIRMPGMTGLELLKLLPEISPHSRLILISGYAEFSYAQEAVQNHAFDYLLKPIKEEELERVVRVLSESKGNRRPPLNKRQEPVIPESMVDNVISEIRKRYAENLSLTELAERNSVSPGRLSTMIKEKVGMTFSDLVVSLRMQKAKELLMNDRLSIQEIAEKVGYNDYFYFTKVFKRTENISPSKYRKTLSKI